jgi:hypothetical protein
MDRREFLANVGAVAVATGRTIASDAKEFPCDLLKQQLGIAPDPDDPVRLLPPEPIGGFRASGSSAIWGVKPPRGAKVNENRSYLCPSSHSAVNLSRLWKNDRSAGLRGVRRCSGHSDPVTMNLAAAHVVGLSTWARSSI